MTSYTRKLHAVDPSAARAIHRQQYADYRYGKSVTLATFSAVTHGLTPSRQFGRRAHAPATSAYECWAPELGKPKAILRAPDSFAARQQYAKYYQIAVTEVAARLMGSAR